jgi:hypothetical protein
VEQNKVWDKFNKRLAKKDKERGKDRQGELAPDEWNEGDGVTINEDRGNRHIIPCDTV